MCPLKAIRAGSQFSLARTAWRPEDEPHGGYDKDSVRPNR